VANHVKKEKEIHLRKQEKLTMTADLTQLTRSALVRELEQQRDAIRELAANLDEAAFWSRPLEPSNSIGHLLLHLTGNLNHFVGGQIGGSGYVRDRPREFTETAVPTKTDALAGLDDAVAAFRRVVEGLTAEQLTAAHPEARFGNVIQALISVVSHFALHRGQISYLARLVKTPR
jgi:uncharacterized damage-inducible protein DinB